MWFFPEGLRNVLELFPFVYIFQLPLDIYIGKVDTVAAMPRVGIQLAWMIILLVLYIVN